MHQTDVAIIGGGVAGLWLLNLLNKAGYHAVLVEKDQLGGAQSFASQGMIHGGVKYMLSGDRTDASETIADMPARWRACLEGSGELDLQGVNQLSSSYYMFSDAALTSKVTAFFGSKAIKGRVRAVDKSAYPEAFQDKQFTGMLYELLDLVIDTPSLISILSEPWRQRIFQGNPEISTSNGEVSSIKLDDGTEIQAASYVFAAGAGNAALIDAANIACSMQRRPLHQVIVEGKDLPDLYAHAVNLRSGDKPRLTITTHHDDHRTFWYLGGALAETGVKRNEAAQIKFAQAELEAVMPWIDLASCRFSTLRVDRAEANQKEGIRPDTPFVRRYGNTIVCWPTKLTLTPMMGDLFMQQLDTRPANPALTDTIRLSDPPTVASPPWV